MDFHGCPIFSRVFFHHLPIFCSGFPNPPHFMTPDVWHQWHLAAIGVLHARLPGKAAVWNWKITVKNKQLLRVMHRTKWTIIHSYATNYQRHPEANSKINEYRWSKFSHTLLFIGTEAENKLQAVHGPWSNPSQVKHVVMGGPKMSQVHPKEIHSIYNDVNDWRTSQNHQTNLRCWTSWHWFWWEQPQGNPPQTNANAWLMFCESMSIHVGPKLEAMLLSPSAECSQKTKRLIPRKTYLQYGSPKWTNPV